VGYGAAWQVGRVMNTGAREHLLSAGSRFFGARLDRGRPEARLAALRARETMCVKRNSRVSTTALRSCSGLSSIPALAVTSVALIRVVQGHSQPLVIVGAAGRVNKPGSER
jgi:hypothetical protein